MLSSDPRLPQITSSESQQEYVSIGFWRRFQERFYSLWRELSRNDAALQAAVAPLSRITIDSSGNVGFGTSSPVLPTSGQTSFTVSGSTGRGNIYVTTAAADGASVSCGSVAWHGGASTSSVTSDGRIAGIFAATEGTTANHRGGYMQFNTKPDNGNFTERMRITSAGEVYIAGTTDQGAYNLQCNGTGVWGAGAYVNGSDARIKENVTPIASGLSVVAKLNPVTFNYLESWSSDRATQTGFIAQELQTAMAEEVYVDGVVQQGPEYMSVAYQALIPILTKAIQEQQSQIAALQAEIQTLKA